MKRGFMILLAVLSVLMVTACNNNDAFSGKTFDVSLASGLNYPGGKFYPIAILEFSDRNTVKNKMGYEEGTYELKDDKLVLQFENENESLEIEITLEESDKESIAYFAETSDTNFQMKDSKQVSHYQGLYFQMTNLNFALIERTEG